MSALIGRGCTVWTERVCSVRRAGDAQGADSQLGKDLLTREGWVSRCLGERQLDLEEDIMTKIVNAWNEWDPLKRLILGRPEGSHVAAPEPAAYSHQPDGGYPLGTYGPYPQEMVDEANEQMDNFVKILEHRGITVDRVEVHPVVLGRSGQWDTRLDDAQCPWHKLPP